MSRPTNTPYESRVQFSISRIELTPEGAISWRAWLRLDYASTLALTVSTRPAQTLPHVCAAPRTHHSMFRPTRRIHCCLLGEGRGRWSHAPQPSGQPNLGCSSSASGPSWTASPQRASDAQNQRTCWPIGARAPRCDLVVIRLPASCDRGCGAGRSAQRENSSLPQQTRQ